MFHKQKNVTVIGSSGSAQRALLPFVFYNGPSGADTLLDDQVGQQQWWAILKWTHSISILFNTPPALHYVHLYPSPSPSFAAGSRLFLVPSTLISTYLVLVHLARKSIILILC